ncbi:hypothetical protein BaRGS_00019503 [Batillaria attramentaria]|uniref:Peroxisomal biogenesis factor 11 n=1 Tax=Batillaria attramentaria TaxID=370345 RepID=A0ABD0KPT1_9CAEN
MDGDLLGKIVKFNSQASGRDKLFRLVQYCSKFTWWYLYKAQVAENSIDKLQKLSAALSTCRKFLRFGKSVDFLHSALRSLHISDDVLRWTITLSKINQAVFLVFDHIVLAGRIGLAQVDKDKWNRLSAQFWLVTLILGIVRDLYDITSIISHELRIRSAKLSQRKHFDGEEVDNNNRRRRADSIPTQRQVVWRSLADNQPVVLDLLKNLCDLVLPLEALGHVDASPGVQGLFGAVSSMIGVMTTWQPLLRLVPS